MVVAAKMVTDFILWDICYWIIFFVLDNLPEYACEVLKALQSRFLLTSILPDANENALVPCPKLEHLSLLCPDAGKQEGFVFVFGGFGETEITARLSDTEAVAQTLCSF